MFTRYDEVLKNCTLFNGIESKNLHSMLNCLEPKIKHFHRNEIIALAGDVFHGIGVILKGQTSINKENANGDRVIMAILQPGDMFGEMIAFSSTNIWPATVEAHEDSHILFLSKDKLVERCGSLCPWHTMLIKNMLKIISERALMLSRKVEYLSIKSMRGKISSFLLEQYKKAGNLTYILPMNRNELADFLNVSRPSMSRELSRMKDEGVIDFHLATIQIKDLEALKRMIG